MDTRRFSPHAVRLTVALCVCLLSGATAIAAPGDEVGTPQHTWAPNSLIAPTAGFGEGNTFSTLKQKWAAAPANGLAVTICESKWASLNGTFGYVDALTIGSARILIWADAAFTVPIAPTLAETTVPPSNQVGYLQGSNGGKLIEGHVACPPTPACGDGLIHPTEQCDDGNLVNGDGCSDTCLIEGVLFSLQHLWASTHATATGGNGNTTLLTKFGCGSAAVCNPYNGRQVRVCLTGWPSVNGTLVYLDQSASGGALEWFSMWLDAAFSVPVPDPPESAVPTPCCEAGRLSGPPAGLILDAADACPAPRGACCSDGPGIQSDCLSFVTQASCETDAGLYLGDGSKCNEVIDCIPLLVTFESLSAVWTSEGVLVSWTTAQEIDTTGFRLLRETTNGPEKTVRVIAPFIPAAGHGLVGATYQFLDNARQHTDVVRYYVEDIDLDGRVTRHGPILVDRLRTLRQRQPASAPKR